MSERSPSREIARLMVIAIVGMTAACNPRPTAPGPRRPNEIARIRQSRLPGQMDNARPFFLPGELHVWSYSFLGVTVGRTRVSVGQPIVHEGRRLIDVSWQSELVGIASQFMTAQISSRSWIDTATGHSMSTSYQGDMKVDLKFGKQERQSARRIITRDDKTGKLRIQTWRDGHDATDSTRALPKPNDYDPASAFLVLRGWDAPIGGRTKIRIGLVGGGGDYELVVESREVLHSRLGRTPTVRIAAFKSSRARRAFTLWISNDKKRLPLRLTLHTKRGDFVIEAVHYLVNGHKSR